MARKSAKRRKQSESAGSSKQQLDARQMFSPALVGVAAGLWGMLLFADSIGYEFVYDDVQIVQLDQRLDDPTYFANVWFEPWWPEGSSKSESRPLTSLSFWLHRQLHGADAYWPHVINVALFGILTWLVAILAARWLDRNWAAWPAGFIFASHPLHVEAVANVVGRAETLSAIFVVLALLLWLKWRGRMDCLRAATIAVLVLLAGQSKETGYLTAPMLLLGELALRRNERKPVLQQPWLVPLWTLLFVVACLAVLQRGMVAERNELSGRIVQPTTNPLVLANTAERLVTPLKLTGKALQLLAFPYDLAPDYSPRSLMPTSDVTDIYVMLGMLGVALWGLAVVVAWRQRLRFLGPLLVLPVAWLIPSNSIILIGTIFGDRLLMLLTIFAPIALIGIVDYLSTRRVTTMPLVAAVSIACTFWYVPVMLSWASSGESSSLATAQVVRSIGFATLLLAAAVVVIRKGVQKSPVLIIVSTVLALGWTTLTYGPMWKTWDSLLRSTVQRHPENGRFQAEFSLDLVQRAISDPGFREDWPQLARQIAMHALELWPTQVTPHITLACVASQAGNRQLAAHELEVARRYGVLLSRYEDVLIHFQLIEDPEQIKQRIANIQRELATDPDNRELLRELGQSFLDDSKFTEAIVVYDRLVGTDLDKISDSKLLREYERALSEFRPPANAAGNGPNQLDLDEVKRKAIAVHRQLVHLHPDDWTTHVQAAQMVMVAGGDPALARSWIDRAIQLAPRESGPWAMLAAFHRTQEDLDQARQAIEKAIELTPPGDRRIHSYRQVWESLRP